jgi:hypothetical protein
MSGSPGQRLSGKNILHDPHISPAANAMREKSAIRLEIRDENI